ncbi:MAG: hypothetical protein GX754_03725 [Clostridiaceae bacterium]|nr:hypothetical protein [Clostridiaceae bacterium]
MVLKKVEQIKEKSRRTIRNKILGINAERMLFISFMTFFILLIMAQIILVIPGLTENMNLNMHTEGTPLKNEEYLFSHGELTLKLLGKGTGKDVKILVNGEEKDAFTNSEKTIKVKYGDVIEIDNTKSSDYVEIEIVSKSNNIMTAYVGQKFRIKKEVKKIMKVRIQNNL